jgi:hypothetical protein
LPTYFVYGKYVKAHGTLLYVTLREEAPRGPADEMPLFLGDAKFRKGDLILPSGPGSHLDERQRLTIIRNEVNLALGTTRHVVPGDEHISVAPQIPVGKRLAAYCRDADLFPSYRPALLPAGSILAVRATLALQR